MSDAVQAKSAAELEQEKQAVEALRAELDARISETPTGDLIVELVEPVKSADGGSRGRVIVRRVTLAAWRAFDRSGDFDVLVDALCETKEHLGITNIRDAWALERAVARQREKFQRSGA